MSAHPENERPFFVSKEMLDTTNSISWLFLDACWMLGITKIAYALIVPTVVTGLLLLYIEKRIPVMFINLAIMSWIFMNAFWMLGDTLAKPEFLFAARVSSGFGLACIVVAAILSKDVKETFSHFRRFRTISKL